MKRILIVALILMLVTPVLMACGDGAAFSAPNGAIATASPYIAVFLEAAGEQALMQAIVNTGNEKFEKGYAITAMTHLRMDSGKHKVVVLLKKAINEGGQNGQKVNCRNQKAGNKMAY